MTWSRVRTGAQGTPSVLEALQPFVGGARLEHVLVISQAGVDVGSRSAGVLKRASSSHSGRSSARGQRRPLLVAHDGGGHEAVPGLVDEVDEARGRARRHRLRRRRSARPCRRPTGTPAPRPAWRGARAGPCRSCRRPTRAAAMACAAVTAVSLSGSTVRIRRGRRSSAPACTVVRPEKAWMIGIVGGLVGVGALLAEAADRDVDDAGRDRADGGLVEAEPLDHAGPEVLHEHVGAGGQPLDDVGALRGLEVDGERALVAVEVEELAEKPLRRLP